MYVCEWVSVCVFTYILEYFNSIFLYKHGPRALDDLTCHAYRYQINWQNKTIYVYLPTATTTGRYYYFKITL